MSSPTCLGCPVPDALSQMFCPVFPVKAVLLRFPCLSCLVPTTLSTALLTPLSCFAVKSFKPCDYCHIQTHLSMCRCDLSGWPVPAMLSRMSFPRCPIPTVLPRLSHLVCPILVDLSILSYSGRPVLCFLSRLYYPNCLLRLACPGFSVPAALSRPSCPSCPLLAALFQLFYPKVNCVPNVLSLLLCADRPVPVSFQADLSRFSCPGYSVELSFPLACATSPVFSGCPIRQSCPCCPVLTILSQMPISFSQLS